MATISTALRTVMADDFANNQDRLELLDAAVVVATITLNWGAAVNGVVTSDPAEVLADAGTEVDGARLYKDGATTEQVTGLTVSTVAAGTGQVQLVSLSVAEGQPVNLSSVTYTAPTTL